MALEVQNQQPQPLQLHVAGDSTAIRGGHNHRIAAAAPTNFALFHHSHHPSSPPPIGLEEPSPLPLGWQKFLNLQTGKIYYSKTEEKELTIFEGERTMSRRNGPKLDLKLNLSPPRVSHPRVESPSRSLTVSPTSPPSSCVSLELNQQDECLRYSTSPEATSMMLVGCPRCLMYVMLAEEDPRCPKCKSTVLLDVIHDNNTTTTTSRKAKKS